MSTIVYQGLPSFLDSQLNESRTLRLKLASPRSHLTHSLEMAICTVLDSDSKILFRENGDPVRHKCNNPSAEPSSKPRVGELTFLQTLPSIAQMPNERQNAYVHPLVKRASSVLSDKSLEICTENLGSETGTDIIEDENIIFSGNSSRKVNSRKSHVASSRRMSPKEFPPPLSTMMGSETVQVIPIRENGRLILQAVKVQPRASCFQADRSNGRLRLRLNSFSSDQGTSDQDRANDDDIENGSKNSSESAAKEGMVGKGQGRCKESECAGNTEGLLLDGSKSLGVASR